MKQLIFFVIIFWIALSCFPSQGRKYSIDKDKVEQYRQKPITDSRLLEIIATENNFINLSRNPNISEATLEHHLIEKIELNGNSTFIIFEYFTLEGVSCNIQAVTINNKNKLLSIIRLANYEEYPDGQLNEFSILQDDFLTRTTVINGLQEYSDSLDKIIMRVDSTIVRYKFNNFNKIELVDSIFKHNEYFE